MRRPVQLLPVAVLVAVLTGCSSSASPSDPGTSVQPSTGAGSTPTTASRTPPTTPKPPDTTAPGTSSPGTPGPTSTAQVQFASMSLAQRVGQLFMVDCPSTSVGDATATAISRYHVGSVILDGNSTLGVVGTAAIVQQLQNLVARGPRLFVATDQEGGLVQRLRGPDFSDIPSAVQQGTEDPGKLQVTTTQWAGQLRAAGVNVDLAPVLDTVPAGSGPNPPIGDLQRQYGSKPKTVTSHGVAVLKGILDAGIVATAKHFPGLGRVAGNTDTTSGVRDTVTTRHDRYLAPFAAAIKAHAPFVMMSTAIYTKIDPDHPAAFSRKIVTGMLRGDLGFAGVVISDDLGAAQQVSGYSVGARAVAFIAAGGDIVLTVDASQAAAMTHAVLAKAARDPAFKALVNAAALRVLQAKQALGLLP